MLLGQEAAEDEAWRRDWNERWLSTELKWGLDDFLGLREEMNAHLEKREASWAESLREKEETFRMREAEARDAYARAFEEHVQQMEVRLRAADRERVLALQDLGARRDAVQSAALMEAMERSQKALTIALQKQRVHLDTAYSRRIVEMQQKYSKQLGSMATVSVAARHELDSAQQRCARQSSEQVIMERELRTAQAVEGSVRQKLSAAGKVVAAVDDKNKRLEDELDNLRDVLVWSLHFAKAKLVPDFNFEGTVIDVRNFDAREQIADDRHE